MMTARSFPSVCISLRAALTTVTIGLVFYPMSIGSHHGSTQRHLQKRLEEVFHRFSPLVTSHATLQHGDNCISPYEEKLRQQIAEELHLIANNHATIGRVKDAIKKMEEFMSMNDKELCNYKLALVCDAELKKCVCGPTRVNVTFLWEGHQCRYAEGSMCLANSKIGCAQGSSCISMSSLEECMSGLCFCQRDFYMTTTTQTPTTTSSSVEIPPGENEDDVAQESNGKDDSLEHVIATKVSPKESSSSEEDVGEDDDDDGDGERERIIVVKVSEVEKPLEEVDVTQQPFHSLDKHHDIDEFEEHTTDSTTVPTPMGTSPTPTRRQELTSAIRRLEKEVEAIKSLAFADDCSSIREESNYAEYRRLVNEMNCVTDNDDEVSLMEILSKLEVILESGNSMCNLTKHLECSSQSKRCECRTSSEDLDGFYLLFMEESRRCVLTENSRCLSQDYLISKKLPHLEIPCNNETKCIAEETRGECKSKVESCFCRKIVKPTEASKQKKNRSKSKTSSAVSTTQSTYFPFVLSLILVSTSFILPVKMRVVKCLIQV